MERPFKFNVRARGFATNPYLRVGQANTRERPSTPFAHINLHHFEGSHASVDYSMAPKQHPARLPMRRCSSRREARR